MHAKREKKQNELEDGDNDGTGLQINTPQTGILRLARRVAKYREQGTGNREQGTGNRDQGSGIRDQSRLRFEDSHPCDKKQERRKDGAPRH
jgi:hypothetical protein